MEAFLLWVSGIAWGVKCLLAVYACLNLIAAILVCIHAGCVAGRMDIADNVDAADEFVERKKKEALKLGLIFFVFAVVSALFPSENTWLGWLEIARRP